MKALKSLTYFFLVTTLVGSLSFLAGYTIDTFFRRTPGWHFSTAQISRPYSKMNRSKLSVNSETAKEKEYCVLMPSSLDIEDTKKFVNGVVRGLGLGSNDLLTLILFGNTAPDVQVGELAAESRIDKQVASIYQYLLDYKGRQFGVNIQGHFVDYNKLGNKKGLELLDIMLGSHRDAKAIYTASHGFTAENGFITFCNRRLSTSKEQVFFHWEQYFFTKKWLDLSCGSTSPADPYSHQRRRNKLDKDGLVRIITELPQYIKRGYEIKQQMFGHYLKQKSANHTTKSIKQITNTQ